ncbi:MAG: phosphoribosyltransferase family protein [Bacteroidota bacterium]|nr:phosphoribosyltransferase family protein [Bacteroidota bacterium]
MPANFIMSKEIAYRKIQRIAYEITEHNINEKQIIIAGIKKNGLIIANILHGFLKEIFKGEIIVIGINLNKKDPKNASVSDEIDFENKIVIITDDVVNSGRTLLYALKPFLDFYPKKIQTLVLVERSHKEFPVTPDYVGLSISTALSEKIIVETEGGEILGARINP